ncbi:MAG TPA: hypothetical protein VIM65_12325 [Cyclobacteriaceae bacterium]
MELINKNSRRSSVRLSRDTYELIFNLITSTLQEKGEITVNQLLDYTLQDNAIKVKGDLGWLLLQVKQDLEARGIIKVKLGIGTQRIQKIKLVKWKFKAALSELKAMKLSAN